MVRRHLDSRLGKEQETQNPAEFPWEGFLGKVGTVADDDEYLIDEKDPIVLTLGR